MISRLRAMVCGLASRTKPCRRFKNTPEGERKLSQNGYGCIEWLFAGVYIPLMGNGRGAQGVGETSSQWAQRRTTAPALDT